MKFTATKSNLVKLLTRCATIARPKSPSPVLACVLLEATSDRLQGSATDTYQEISTSVPIDGTKPGQVAVSAKDLLDRVKSLPDGPVTFDTPKDKLIVTAGKRKHTLPILSVDHFPKISPPPNAGITMPKEELATLFQKTKFAIAHDDIGKPALRGVLLEFEDGRIYATTTDGHRLSFASFERGNVEKGKSRVVPLAAIDSLLSFLVDDDDVLVSTTDDTASFAMQDLCYATKLIAEEFPPFRHVFGTEPPHRSVIDKQQWLDSIGSVEKASPEGDHRGFLKLSFAPGVCHVSAQGKGAAEDELEAVYNGPEFVIGVYHRYLAEAIAACDSERVRLSVGGELDPIWVRPDTGDELLGVVMPARL